eukprot:tig00000037_g10098.t1
MGLQSADPPAPGAPLQKKPVPASTLAAGALMQVIEVSTLGQPFEVMKTHMAANRGDNIPTTLKKTWQRGGVLGFYQGLIPWAWIEAATKGAVLFLTQAEVEYRMKRVGYGHAASSTVGGMAGGVVQAYATMGFCTFMKTVEVTRHKAGGEAESSIKIARDILAREGIAGLNKGVSAVALRQLTNWGSRFGIARLLEDAMRKPNGEPLSVGDRITAAAVGGALGCWNQPFEVIRVEMQSQVKSADRPANMNVWTAAKYIHSKSGFIGFYRGVTPRIGLGVWQTVCMVAGGEELKKKMAVWMA